MVTVWNLQTTFDRRVTYPGETVFSSFTIQNALPYLMFISGFAWNTKFYPVTEAVNQTVSLLVPPGGVQPLGTGTIQVPEVPDGAYPLDVSVHTHVLDSMGNAWSDLGMIPLSQPSELMVVHQPRYRAFVSRSNRPEDGPLADFAVSTIQEWGFDTHTVGINEIVSNPKDAAPRILEEITKADCLIAIATPRDVTGTENLYKTLVWLQNELSMAFAAQKTLLVFADQSVQLEGLLGDPNVAVVPYDPTDALEFRAIIDASMPPLRNVISAQKAGVLAALIERRERVVAYGAFVAGSIKNLPDL